MRSKNFTNETHFPSLSVSSDPHIKPLDVAGGLAASDLCASKWGSF